MKKIKNSPRNFRKGFTLVELLVVIIIIALLAGALLGALNKTREAARAAATKATIAKLNDLVMRWNDQYATRPVPINLMGVSPAQAAQTRLYALRDIMRMEMPERWNDVSNGPITAVAQPALQRTYQAIYNNDKGPLGTGIGPDHAGAKCLYMWLTAAMPDCVGLFSSAEVGAIDGDGLNMFLDGWGRPICFLRWAPGYSPNSDIQVADPTNHHDPLDYRNVDSGAYHLIPLIYAGVVYVDTYGYDNYGLSPQQSIQPTTTPCTSNATVGQVTTGGPPHYTNHHIDQK